MSGLALFPLKIASRLPTVLRDAELRGLLGSLAVLAVVLGAMFPSFPSYNLPLILFGIYSSSPSGNDTLPLFQHLQLLSILGDFLRLVWIADTNKGTTGLGTSALGLFMLCKTVASVPTASAIRGGGEVGLGAAAGGAWGARDSAYASFVPASGGNYNDAAGTAGAEHEHLYDVDADAPDVHLDMPPPSSGAQGGAKTGYADA